MVCREHAETQDDGGNDCVTISENAVYSIYVELENSGWQ